MRAKLLVVGGTGLVGNALVRAWARRGGVVTAATFHCHPSSAFRALDMQDRGSVVSLLDELKPDVVAIPAANPYVDYIEQHPEETRKVNVEGTLNVARAAAERGMRSIFWSSDYVFDGERGSYTEDDPVSPLSEYGRQKAEVEAAMEDLSSSNLVIRTSGAYGWQWEPKNFVLQVLRKVAAREPLRVSCDTRYNPTYVENMAEVVSDLIEGDAGGIFHVVGADSIVRSDFAKLAASVFGHDPSFITPVLSNEFKAPAPRPKQSSLVTEKVRRTVQTKLMTAREGLEHMRGFEPKWREYAERSLPAVIRA